MSHPDGGAIHVGGRAAHSGRGVGHGRRGRLSNVDLVDRDAQLTASNLIQTGNSSIIRNYKL